MNLSSIETAAIAAAKAEADKVFPEIIEGSEPVVLATVAAVFDIVRAALTAGASRVPFVGSFIAGVAVRALTVAETTVDAFIQAKAGAAGSAAKSL